MLKQKKKEQIYYHNGEPFKYVSEFPNSHLASKLSKRMKREGFRIRIKFIGNKFVVFKGERRKVWGGK